MKKTLLLLAIVTICPLSIGCSGETSAVLEENRTEEELKKEAMDREEMMKQMEAENRAN